MALFMKARGAEASIGLEGEDIFETFFKHLEDEGMKIPDELKETIKNIPRLRKMLDKAGKGRDLSPEMQKAA
jgi:hypothetical protein